jgi:membrane protease YdiL (CAAX protease family)
VRESGSPVGVAVQAVVVGTGVVLAGTMPRNLVFLANLRFHPELPWAVPVVGIYLWLFWRYLGGSGPPASTADVRRESLRAAPLRGVVWRWALLAGGLAIAALVVALRLANRFVTLPAQQLPDLSHVPTVTILSLLLMGAPVAGAVEEAAFRGYMQGPIERACGIVPAVLVTGTMFAVAHLDFTPVLWPYYVAVAAIYGTVTWRTGSILPAIVLHTAGNVYSNLDLWVHGQAEWQAGSGSAGAIWPWSVALVALIGATVWSGSGLARVTRDRIQAAVEGRAT